MISLNHNLLRVLGVSHPALEEIIQIASKYDLHAKLTGGGGGGFAFIYLPDNTETCKIKDVKKVKLHTLDEYSPSFKSLYRI